MTGETIYQLEMWNRRR